MLALQQIDSALDQIEHRRRRLPEAATQAQLHGERDRIRAAIAELDAAIAAAETVIGECETAGHAVTTKRTRLEAQLKTVIAPREAEALMHEIATLNTQRGELDDRELAALDDAAAAEAQRAVFAERLADLAPQLASASEALARANAALDGERDQQRAAARSARELLDADQQTRYDDLRRQLGGVAVARLEGLRCSGCHVDLSRAEADRVKALPADEAGECPQCLRLLAH